MWPLVLVVAPPVLVVAALALTTTQGARRRGHRWVSAVLAVVAFPVTWALWYAVDRDAARARDVGFAADAPGTNPR